jgi:hypothetical protein
MEGLNFITDELHKGLTPLRNPAASDTAKGLVSYQAERTFGKRP